MAKLYSYVVARDYGFAPNPFNEWCTLATCKPGIRRTASIDDWVVGTGSTENGKVDCLVYAMRVCETMTFNEYWQDARFRNKRPNLYGSMRQSFGDNIYHRDSDSEQWQQEDSHHSYRHGEINCLNIDNDTKADRVLISDEFIYWGKSGPKVPKFQNTDIRKKGSGHKCRFPEKAVNEFINWFRAQHNQGYCGEPFDWPKSP